MALFIFGDQAFPQGVRMGELGFDFLALYANVTASATELRVFDGPEDFAVFRGTGIVPVFVGGELAGVSAGTVTSIEVVAAGVSGFLVEGLSIDAPRLVGLIEDRDWATLRAELLAGDDEIRGTASRDQLLGLDGADDILGRGGNDTLAGGAGNDRLAGDAGDDRLLGGDGNDRLAGGAGNDLLGVVPGPGGLLEAGNDTLLGGAGDDFLSGFLGRDRLAGGAGGDALSGGAGNDILLGGAGRDSFAFADRRADGTDRIVDFEAGVDRIVLFADGFGIGPGRLDPDQFAEGFAAVTEATRLIYDAGTGALFADIDGLGGAAAVQFARLAPGTALGADDIFGTA